MFSQDRNQLRNYYIQAWKKARASSEATLEPLEKLIVSVIQAHPEYHSILEDPGMATELEYVPESGQSNPFLHMGMHLAIQEQLGQQRPTGINEVWLRLSQLHNSSHEAEHQMMECLAETLWIAQQDQNGPDEAAYLERLKKIT